MDEKTKNRLVVALIYFLWIAAGFATYVQFSDDLSYASVADAIEQQQEVEKIDPKSLTIYITTTDPFPRVYNL